MDGPDYHQFGSPDGGMTEPRIIPQRGMKGKLFYVLYGGPVLLLLILVLVTGIKLTQVNHEIADVKLYLKAINPKGLSGHTASLTSAGTVVQQVYLEAIVPVRGPCAEGWVFFQNRCYLLSKAITTWHGAEDQCKKLGGHLLVLNNVEELDYISKVIEIAYNYWIGLVERAHEGHWSWVDGTDFKTTPTFWDEDQPDDWDYRLNGEDCGQLHSSVKRKRKLWNDADCNLQYRYICEAAKPGQQTR
ncbi:perlucin-like protein [Myripristis murdjan]|uniref:Asialoglycoprotein receptor-like 1 n=1 Tax=Myripristis murdjan TaxID=586833 RepID=A0A667ZWS6_9TELE|nr:perlucin-like protein [Myripristis murdjan]